MNVNNNKMVSLSQAVGILRSGRVVVFPTETVYGLGADAASDYAVARIYEVKNRPTFNPLIIHFRSIEQISQYVELDKTSISLAKQFWPGPMTLVLKKKLYQNTRHEISLLPSAGLDTIGVRIPNHPIALELLTAFDKPIAAPSANISMSLSPTSADDALCALGNIDVPIIDGGVCDIGIESTIIDVTREGQIDILRPGFITAADIASVTPARINAFDKSSNIKAPGQMKRHYAPKASIRLNTTFVKPGEALLGFGDTRTLIANSVDLFDSQKEILNIRQLNLSTAGDLREAAANLFSMLRQLDYLNPEVIAVMPIPNAGIGVAINDRLSRAAFSDND